MRLLALTQVYPNSKTPGAAPFLRRQCAALQEQCELLILATLPWYPGAGLLHRFSYWGEDFTTVPAHERVGQTEVLHPRYLQVPKLLWPRAATYALSLLPLMAHYRGRLDAILATWAYPDGVAAIALGRALGIPVFVQVIGTDINRLARVKSARLQLEWALPWAHGVVCVSRELARKVQDLGATPDAVRVIKTGLDRDRFKPQDRQLARAALGVDPSAKLILFVGRLYAEKGLRELVRAFTGLAASDPAYRLVIIGAGPLGAELPREAGAFTSRMALLGECDAATVAHWLAACNLLALPSYEEGTPNVIMEALSSGRPVVATGVGGIPDLVTSEASGLLVAPRDVEALRTALASVASRDYSGEAVAASVELYDWQENARRLLGFIESRLTCR